MTRAMLYLLFLLRSSWSASDSPKTLALAMLTLVERDIFSLVRAA
jgi:hypothetical protein